MTSRIPLKEPYHSSWSKGYLRKSSQSPRMLLDLVNSDEDRTTTSFARYLFSVKLGYLVPEGFEIDHIDGDPSNDDISNLQMLTVEEHIRKSSEERSGRTFTELTCPNCYKTFETESRNIRPDRVRNFCSRSCNGKFHHGKGNLTSKRVSGVWDIQDKVRAYRILGYSDYKIAEVTGLTRTNIYYARKVLDIS
ncbi:HNH nuclease [Vibrio phage 1.084.O._10N.261.49.F5]|nr:HNH nuclease [Vibrio phage 1.084.O._10N.261.49.F5]